MTFQEYAEKYNIILNPQQAKAAGTKDGCFMIHSVPGSGKTTVILAHVGYLVLCCNVKPSEILCLTFNKSSEIDLNSRLSSRFGKILPSKNIRTIDAFCRAVVIENITPTVNIINDSEKRNVIRTILKERIEAYLDNTELTVIITEFDKLRRLEAEGELSPEDIYVNDYSSKAACALPGYLEYLEKNKKYEFIDLEKITKEIFETNPDILRKYRETYKYICVDEAQDLSGLQHRIIELLVKGNDNNLFMVGDRDQSIYSFRMASPGNIDDFRNTYPDSRIITMEKNYRSTPQIVEVANNLISYNPNTESKHMIASKMDGSEVVFERVNRVKQYEAISNHILSNPDAEIAILYRDNDSALPFIDRFDRKGITYRVNGARKAADGSLISSRLVSDLRYAVYFLTKAFDKDAGYILLGQAKDIPCVAKIFNYFGMASSFMMKELQKLSKVTYRTNGEKDILSLLINESRLTVEARFIINAVRKLAKSYKEMSATEFVNVLFDETDFSYHEYDTEKRFFKKEICLSVAENCDTPINFGKRLVELNELLDRAKDNTSGILLSTIHSAKGMEFDSVIVVDMIDTLFPKLEPDKINELDNPERLREERNLAYVAATRAKNNLTVLTYDTYNSLFVQEMRKKYDPNALKSLPEKEFVLPINVLEKIRAFPVEHFEEPIEEKTVEEQEDIMAEIKAKFERGEKVIKDKKGIRYRKCVFCGKIDKETEFWYAQGTSGKCNECLAKGLQ